MMTRYLGKFESDAGGVGRVRTGGAACLASGRRDTGTRAREAGKAISTRETRVTALSGAAAATVSDAARGRQPTSARI